MILRIILLAISWPQVFAFFDTRFKRGGAFTTEVQDFALDCFHQPIERPQRYLLEWRVVKGGMNDIDITLQNPKGKTMLMQEKSTHGQYSFEAKEGTYTLCFSNEFSQITHKRVYFSLAPEQVLTLEEEVGQDINPLPKTNLEFSFDRIHANLSVIAMAQIDLMNKGSAGYSIADHLNHCVQLWSMALCLFILVSSLGQVVVLRLFFTEHSPHSLEYGMSQYVDPSGTPAL